MVDGWSGGWAVPGMDQTAYAAEVWGVLQVVLACEGMEGDMCLLVDNKAAQTELQAWIEGAREVLGNMPRTWRRIREAVQNTPGLRSAWLPSHDKVKEGWQPPQGWTEEECRALNKKADEECTAGLERLNRGM